MLPEKTSFILRVACVVPTFNGGGALIRLFDALADQTIPFDLFVVDSSSDDGTLAIVNERVEQVTSIPSSQFNHGGTRQMMIDAHPGYDIYVFLTQDARPANPQAIARLIAPFCDDKVGAVCGRQLPHEDANPFAQHARLFNYPAESRIKIMADATKLGLKAAFMSNSFAAYRTSALQQVHGFPAHVIFGEDMFVAAKMFLAGWKVAYAGDAECYHSHNYTLAQEVRRYFDIGVFHAREPWLRKSFGGAGGEGMRYVKSELNYLGFKRAHLWPGALLRNAFKLMAYKLGQQEKRLPLWLKRRVSMHRGYWAGPRAQGS